jgi:hypothetical protein
MTTEFLQRIRKEIKITLTGLHEIIIAISERANRKVQILKLHGQASSIGRQIDVVRQETGALLASLRLQSNDPGGPPLDLLETETRLSGAAARLRLLKHELTQVDALVRELETEALQEELLRIQHDLVTHAAAVERVVVARGAQAAGRLVGQLGLPPCVRVAAVLRGPVLLADLEAVTLRAGDVIVLLGPRADLKSIRPNFSAQQRALA